MNIFERRDILLTLDQINKIKSAKLALFGLGGVGGYALDLFLRMGIEDFILVDGDSFDETNLNRQLLSNLNNIGKLKVEVAKDYILSINKNAKVITYPIFVNDDNINDLDLSDYYIVDMIDDVKGKVSLIKYSIEHKNNIISMMGAGNRIDAKFMVSDIFKTEVDPLSKKMRSLLKENNIKKLKVVYTNSSVIKTSSNEIGSISYVVSSAANKIVEEVIKDIIK